jgi:glycosyltransferase involved in cell wall biosynthesis
MEDIKISVAMATFNGEKYIKEQIDSILNQTLKINELIISDDGSTDNTINIIRNYNDNRIKLLNGPHNGVKQNFANAINNTTGDIIFLSDQDDVWLNNKVEMIIKVFQNKNCQCIVHDCDVVSSQKVIIDSFFDYRKSKSGITNNIIKNSYLGCCMAFTKNMIKYILPIPNTIEMHDQWIGIICEKHGKSIFLKEKLIHYRRHSDNVSSMKHYPLWKMIKNRIRIIKELRGR